MGSAHTCQLNAKPIARLGMNSQSYSKSHLKMTKNSHKSLVVRQELIDE
jgi:hypothetical protein